MSPIKTGPKKRYWRSVRELQRSPEFEELVQREFPVAASEYPEGMSRRRWLQLMSASIALAGVAGCRWETEQIRPFAKRPDGRIPGEQEQFATSVDLAGVPHHLLVRCYDGRPVKVEGNADHPCSTGSSDVFAQASILSLYDPDRSGDVWNRQRGRPFLKDWDTFEEWAEKKFGELHLNEGAGLAVLIRPTNSPSEQDMLRRFSERFPQASFFEHSSVPNWNEQTSAELAFGVTCVARPVLDKARIIVAFDDDLLVRHPAAQRLAAEFANRRDPDGEWMNRLYAIESQFSTTGSVADHRLAARSSDIPLLLDALISLVDASSSGQSAFDLLTPEEQSLLRAVADDLVKARGESLVTVGPRQPTSVRALAHHLNQLLGNVNQTLVYQRATAATPNAGTLSQLAKQAADGQVKTLLILGGNPVYDAPADIDFQNVLANVEHSIHLSTHKDETSRLCDWHLPQSHPFESWGDQVGEDGTWSPAQPLIDPLLNGRSVIEVLALLIGEGLPEGDFIVRRTLEAAVGGLSESGWQQALHDGFVRGSAGKVFTPPPAALPRTVSNTDRRGRGSREELEVVFCAGEATFDGSFANNAWLQETPGTLTKLTWDNAALMSPKTAEELGVEHEAIIELELEGRRIELPVFILPGQAERSIGLSLGYGRTAAGLVGGDTEKDVPSVGVNVNLLRPHSNPSFALGASVRPTGRKYSLATTQEHHAVDTEALEEIGGRVGELARETTLAEYKESTDDSAHHGHHAEAGSLWEEPAYDDRAWGMSIDLNKCIGCNACSVACQSENNVPVVGKDQVLKGREMHWIRSDRYFTGDMDSPTVVHQPVACHHCENAPCEQVCPVAATVHSREGLNDMVYNRCIGTRYCANNCPYKVRRFNFFDYNESLEQPGRELVQLAVNPEVTVRSRGVMEKCTYCVQRIQAAKIDSKISGRPIRDGEVKTACQQACPTSAIEFGDLNDHSSRVYAAQNDRRAYGMLAELNVKPRTKYLTRIRNPNPNLASGGEVGHKKEEQHGDLG